MIRNTQQANAPHFLPGALFHLQNAPEQRRKRAHPPILCIRLPVSTPYRGGCAVNFTPCTYAKSLARLALRAPLSPDAGFRPLPSQSVM